MWHGGLRQTSPSCWSCCGSLCRFLREQTALKTRFLSIPESFAAGPVEEIRSRVLQSKGRTLCRRKPGLFAQLLQVLQCFAQCPYRSSIRQRQASWCLLIRQKPTMATIDVSLDELTGATIIITTAIISLLIDGATDRGEYREVPGAGAEAVTGECPQGQRRRTFQ